MWGGTKINLSGPILHGDDVEFKAVADKISGDAVVILNSRGGYIVPAINIGRMVRDRGFSTLVTVPTGPCASSCTYIWLAGRHSIVQRNSILAFHAPSLFGHATPEGSAFVAAYLRQLGLTEDQILYAIGTPPQMAQVAMEADAAALGIHPQMIPLDGLLGGWKACKSKYCLVLPVISAPAGLG
jgi:hypothetical protein